MGRATAISLSFVALGYFEPGPPRRSIGSDVDFEECEFKGAKPFEKQPTLSEIKTRWFKAQSKPPCHMFHRPSGQTLGTTPDWTLTAKPVSY